MLKKLLVTTSLSVLILGFVLLFCKLPEEPAGPEDAKISLLFKDSNGKLDNSGAIIDAVGKEIQIGVIINLTQYIDSTIVRILSGADTVRTFPWKFKNNTVDTVFFSMTFTKTGTYTIEATGYMADQTNPVAKGKIIINGPQAVNKTPVVIVPDTITVGAGQTVSFVVSAADTDTDQKVAVTISQKPESATFTADTFSWTPVLEDTGRHAVIFTATDNGSPVMSATDSVIINVSATQVNRAPQWNTKNIQRTTKPDTLFSFDLGNACSDPDNDIIAYSLIPELPAKDTIIGTTYSFTPTTSDTGKHSIHIVVKDPQGLTDTLTLALTVSSSNSPKKVLPVITFKSPLKDTVIVADSFEVKVTCVADSGCSVKGYRDTLAITMKKSSSTANLWTGMVKGLIAGHYSTIKIVATDSSAAKNKDSASVRIKYDNDKSGPAIALVNPIKDSITTTTSSYTIVLKATDASGILSVKGVSGAAMYTGMRDTGSLWKLNISTLENNKVTAIVITATDSSLNANKSSDTVYIKCSIENGHSVVFLKNDNAATGTMGPQMINSGDTVQLSMNTFAKSGSVFAGWAKAPAGSVFYADGAKYVMGTTDDTLYATWTKNSCTITFDKNGGNVDAVPVSKVVSSGATVDVLPMPPLRVGYTFTGWNTSGNGTGTAFTATTSVTVSDTMFAQWTPITYAITYTLNGGTNSANNPITYSVATPAIALESPAKTGFIFAGWFENASFTGTAVNSIPTGTTGDKAFWAKWTTDGYTISYNLNGGTNNTNNPATYTITTAAITLGAPTRLGYTFGGWFEDPTCSGTAVTSIPTGSTGNKAYWAKWTLDSYTISYTLNGGTNNVINPASYNVSTATITLANPSRTGYIFGGWFDNAGLSGTAITSIPVGSTGDKALWAKWTAEGYTITYILNNGTNNASNPTSYTIASSAITLAAPSRVGFGFAGWFDNSGLTGTAVTSIPAGSTGNKTFWAKWSNVDYIITYTLNGGTNTTSNPATYLITSPAITLVAPTRAGYTFNGWFDNASLSGTAVTSIPAGSTGDKAFWAKWTVIPYTVTFNSQGTTYSTATVNYNSTVTEPAAPTARVCYSFDGWYTSTSFTTIWNFSTDKVLGTTTLYAKWTALTPPVITGPSDQSTCVGTNATFSVSVSGGTGFQYQWCSGNLNNGSPITNATTAQFVTASAGSYYCIVKNSGGCSDTSRVANLLVYNYPTISDPIPASQTVCPGSDAPISVTAPAGTCQWYKFDGGNEIPLTNGAIYSGVNTQYLYIKAQAGTEGTYYCIVTNNGCSKKSTASTLAIYPEITGISISTGQVYYPNSIYTVTVNATAGSGSLRYTLHGDDRVLAAGTDYNVGYYPNIFLITASDLQTSGQHSFKCEIYDDNNCSQTTTTTTATVPTE